jgi:small conductance mechanosensitive channel
MLTEDIPPLAGLFDPDTLPGAITYAVLFFILALVASLIVRRSIRRLLIRPHRPTVDRTAIAFVSQLLQVSVFVVATILYFHLIPALREVGTGMLATAGFASIVLGLAAQNTLGNVISGVSLLIYRPVRMGDEIKVYASAGDETGVVESITLGYTTLSMPNNERIIIPNSVLASTIIVNYGGQKSAESEPPGG